PASVVARQTIVGRAPFAMTPHARAHRRLDDARDPVHRRDVAVARLAADLREQVRRMVEPDELRQRTHARPPYRFARLPHPPQLRDLGVRRQDVFVASDASFERRDACGRRPSGSAVTQLAVELVVRDTYAVAAVARLLRLVLLSTERPTRQGDCGD